MFGVQINLLITHARRPDSCCVADEISNFKGYKNKFGVLSFLNFKFYGKSGFCSKR